MSYLQQLSNSTAIQEELTDHINDLIGDRVLTLENVDDWHHLAFNESYYIIGYYQCSQWLEKHNIGSFEAIGICQEYEKEMFGELHKSYDNSETTVNMLVYILGEEVLHEIQDEIVERLERLEEAKEHWKELSDIPINEDEEIEQDFLHFEKGTHRQDIWGWFEEEYDLSVAEDLMNTD